MNTPPVWLKIDTGTDYENRYILNPLFMLQAEIEMARIRQLGAALGLDKLIDSWKANPRKKEEKG
jgi:hypothetical protein